MVALWNGVRGERISVTTAEEGCKYADGQIFALSMADTVYRGRAVCADCGEYGLCARTPGPGVKYFGGGVCRSCWKVEMSGRREVNKVGKSFLKTYPWPKQKQKARIQLRLRAGVTLNEILQNKSQLDHLTECLKTLTGRKLTIRPHRVIEKEEGK